MEPFEDLDRLACNTLRMLAVDAIEKARSGHPGMAMGAAGMAHVLWSRILKHDPTHPDWPDRDRFILSAGHASMLLYGLLHVSGYDLSMEEIRRFRQLESKTPGHPERGLVPGVEVTTGPLGQGFAMGVGMAMAERRLGQIFNTDTTLSPLVDHHTYVLMSDGDMMEGITQEAASLAGHLRLGKLIALYDKNNISIEGSTDLAFTEDVALRFSACGWQTLLVEDGESLEAIESALLTAQRETEKPSLIVVHTVIGFGSPKQGTEDCHGAPLGEAAITETRRFFNWPEETFHVPHQVRQLWDRVRQKGAKSHALWRQRLQQGSDKHPNQEKQFRDYLNGNLGDSWNRVLNTLSFKRGDWATRTVSGWILNAMAKEIPQLWGGSADLGSSVSTDLVDEPQRIIHFGVREHAMGAIVNGLAAHGGVLPYCGTFFSFSNYMIPAMRMAALMKLRVITIFSHDSIAVGEDGPTHQPVEHLLHLRSIPGMTVIRPGDVWETRDAWRLALELPGPVALILTRQKVPWVDEERVLVEKGAYVRRDCEGEPELILISSGSELVLVLECHRQLTRDGLRVRLVSMPSWELFAHQSDAYREQVLPARVTQRLAIEAASPMGWHRWVGCHGRIIAVEGYGVSGPFEHVLDRFGFSKSNILKTAWSMVRPSDLLGEGVGTEP
ncbi:MAG: transketolase [Nitrospirae bacterium]|nr:transketolase [Magnetococcales bacterium]HAT49067.1 transketolase [Alphaproteobacteria bacterium]